MLREFQHRPSLEVLVPFKGFCNLASRRMIWEKGSLENKSPKWIWMVARSASLQPEVKTWLQPRGCLVFTLNRLVGFLNSGAKWSYGNIYIYYTHIYTPNGSNVGIYHLHGLFGVCLTHTHSPSVLRGARAKPRDRFSQAAQVSGPGDRGPRRLLEGGGEGLGLVGLGHFGDRILW